MNFISDLVAIITDQILSKLQDYADFIRDTIAYQNDIYIKNDYLIQLSKLQKLINQYYNIIKKTQELEKNNFIKANITLENVLLNDQKLLKDYISYTNSIFKRFDIPTDFYEPYQKQLLNDFYYDLKTHNLPNKLKYTKN